MEINKMGINQFQDIATRYKTIFFDAFGVLKNHRGIIPGIEKTFRFLDEHDIDYYILTNDASRSPEELSCAYTIEGIHQITPDKIISSGMLARDWLKLKVKKGTVAYMGTEQSAKYIEAAGLKTMAAKDLDGNTEDVSCMAFLDDEGFSWTNDLNKVVNFLRNNNVPAIVANTDINYPVSNNDVAVAIGSLSNMVEKVVGKKFIRFGKPDVQMFMFGFEKACKNRIVNKNEILMVGDTLFTDIIGGNKFGIDTALVLSGNTLPKMADIRIASSGIIPNYVCPSILMEEYRQARLRVVN